MTQPVSPIVRVLPRDRTGWVIALIIILIPLWYAGTFDSVLYRVGLNKNDCGRNLITGAVFCGDEYDALKERQREFRR